MSPDPRSPAPASRPDLRQIAIVLIAAVCAHALSLGGHLVYDDLHAVRDNEAIRSFANLPRFFVDATAFSSKGAMYRPVVLTSLAIDHGLGSGAVWAFKLGNLLIHALAALLVLKLAMRLRLGVDVATSVAVLFAVHPLASEAVHVISSRSDQLVFIGLLWALCVHLGPRPRHWRSRLQTAVATAVAVGSKETGVAVPAMLLVVEGLRFFRGRTRLSAAAMNLLPSFLVVVVYLLVRRTLLGHATVDVPSLREGADPTIGGQRDLLTQFAIMGQVLPRFFAQAFVPFGLSVDPPFDHTLSPWSLRVLAGYGSVLTATGLGLSRPRTRPAMFLSTCGVWALALPWVLIPLNSPAGEHRVYGPLAFGLLALGGAVAGRRLFDSRVPLAVGATVAVTLLGVSVHRARLHLDPEALWSDTLATNPRSYAGFCGLAEIAQKRGFDALAAGRPELADPEFRRARRMAVLASVVAPRRVRVREKLVAYDLQLREPVPAVVHGRQLVERSPRHAYPRILLAQALTAASGSLQRPGLAEEAEAIALSCLEIAEPRALVFRTAAIAAEAAGSPARAREHFAECRRRGLVFPEMLRDEAGFELRQGDLARAREIAVELQALDPSDPAVFQLLQLATPR